MCVSIWVRSTPAAPGVARVADLVATLWGLQQASGTVGRLQGGCIGPEGAERGGTARERRVGRLRGIVRGTAHPIERLERDAVSPDAGAAEHHGLEVD